MAEEEKRTSFSDDLSRAGFEALTKKDAPFMKDKAAYANLYAYVQIYRKISHDLGTENSDTIHKYMIEHASELKLPEAIANRAELDDMLQYAVQYSPEKGAFPEPKNIAYAYNQYAIDMRAKHREAQSKKDDAEKDIAKSKAEEKEKRKDERKYGWLMNLAVLSGAALVAAIGASVFFLASGAVAGVAATSFAAAAFTVGSTVGGIFGFRKIRQWYNGLKEKRKEATAQKQAEKKKQKELSKELTKKLIPALEKAEGKIQKDAAVELVDLFVNESGRSAAAQTTQRSNQIPQAAAESSEYQMAPPVYERKRPETVLPEATYEEAIPETVLPEAVYEEEIPETVLPEATYEEEIPETVLPEATYEEEIPETVLPEAVYEEPRVERMSPVAIAMNKIDDYLSLEPTNVNEAIEFITNVQNDITTIEESGTDEQKQHLAEKKKDLHVKIGEVAMLQNEGVEEAVRNMFAGLSDDQKNEIFESVKERDEEVAKKYHGTPEAQGFAFRLGDVTGYSQQPEEVIVELANDGENTGRTDENDGEIIHVTPIMFEHEYPNMQKMQEDILYDLHLALSDPYDDGSHYEDALKLFEEAKQKYVHHLDPNNNYFTDDERKIWAESFDQFYWDNYQQMISACYVMNKIGDDFELFGQELDTLLQNMRDGKIDANVDYLKQLKGEDFQIDKNTEFLEFYRQKAILQLVRDGYNERMTTIKLDENGNRVFETTPELDAINDAWNKFEVEFENARRMRYSGDSDHLDDDDDEKRKEQEQKQFAEDVADVSNLMKKSKSPKGKSMSELAEETIEINGKEVNKLEYYLACSQAYTKTHGLTGAAKEAQYALEMEKALGIKNVSREPYYKTTKGKRHRTEFGSFLNSIREVESKKIDMETQGTLDPKDKAEEKHKRVISFSERLRGGMTTAKNNSLKPEEFIDHVTEIGEESKREKAEEIKKEEQKKEEDKKGQEDQSGGEMEA